MRATFLIAVFVFGSALAAPEDVFKARALLDAGDYAAALHAAERDINWKRHGLEAVLIAAQAEIGLERYADAAKRLSAVGRTAADDVERASLYAIALYLDAERNPKLGVDAARVRRREAAAAVEQAFAAGATSTSLHAARTLSLWKLGNYDAAHTAALAWLAAAPTEIEARESLHAIDASAARWAALAPPNVDTAQAPDSLEAREESLIARFAPATRDASVAEIEALLGAETSRTRRAQLLVLRLAAGTSVGRAELAALEAVEAGYLDLKRLAPVIKAVRGLDPASPANNDLRLDGATRPELLLPRTAKPTTNLDVTGGTVASEVLYRVEPDGHVGIAVALKTSVGVSSASHVESVRRYRFRPAVRDGRPVSVPQYGALLLSTFVETGVISLDPRF